MLSSEPHAYTRYPQSEDILALHFAGFNAHFGCRVERLSSDLERALLLSLRFRVLERRTCSKAVFVDIPRPNTRKLLIGGHPRNLELRLRDVLVAEIFSSF